jgi:TusE/DsrC/DsvC family sulfur relay protein
MTTTTQEWTETGAEAIAREHGIDELTDRHWAVIRFMRDRYAATGETPSVRVIGKESGVGVKELYQLFPKAPGKLAALIGGVPKPRGCI